MMAVLFVCGIVKERSEFAKVPRLLRRQVADILIHDFGMPELAEGWTEEG